MVLFQPSFFKVEIRALLQRINYSGVVSRSAENSVQIGTYHQCLPMSKNVFVVYNGAS